MSVGGEMAYADVVADRPAKAMQEEPQLPRSREKRSPQQSALHGLGGPVCDLARSQPHPAVDALPQQVGVSDVAGVLLDHVDQHLPQ